MSSFRISGDFDALHSAGGGSTGLRPALRIFANTKAGEIE
ncbi:hypothetical protein M8PIadj_1380 [Bifidobacterium animalis]|nr:hypothetical protein W91_1397 [Bifidobacterium animalis subsp. lactis Bi-07]AJD34473.1 hypothetical protein BAA6_1360 [Bifidobacterium animalis]QIR81394.1 hypothetical protein M8PIadj_1380 [Bifidobacterium animalis]